MNEYESTAWQTYRPRPGLAGNVAGHLSCNGCLPVAQANEHSATRSLSATTVEPRDEITVTITLSAYGERGSVAEMPPEGFDLVPGSIEWTGGNVFDNSSGNQVKGILRRGARVTNVTYKVTAPPEAGGPFDFTGNFVNYDGQSVDILDVSGGVSMVTVAAGATGGNGEYNLATDSTTPGSNESLVLKSTIDLNNTDNIIVKLGTFGVPGSIDTSDVRISLTGAAAGSGFPSDIEVDGTTVTLVGPVVDGNGDDVGSADHTGATITFRRGAGITLPIRDGDYDVEVENEDGDDDGVENRVNVRREVSVSPKSGKRGTEITINGKGFADGTAAIKIGDRAAFTTAEVDDGAFSLTVDSAAKVNDVNVFGVEKTLINASDAVGNVAEPENGAEFEILPSFTVSPENPLSGADITITLVDVTVGESIPMVSFAGGTASPASPVTTTTTSNDWKATVPDTARIGTIQVKVSVGDTDLTQNITIGTNDLTITPTTVVPRQEISIDGGGFTSRDVATTTKKENTIGADAVMFGETAATHSEQLVNNSGNISFNVQVPDSVTPGTVRVSVQDEGGRIGVATITVSKPNITLDPAESLIGSQVTVSGTGFPANDLVLIKYGGNTVETSATTSTGTFEKTITVPSGNDPGATPTVEAVAQVQDVDPTLRPAPRPTTRCLMRLLPCLRPRLLLAAL